MFASSVHLGSYVAQMKLPESHPILEGKGTGKVPNAQKPKLRPPRGWRDTAQFPARSLPTYTGPYSVGTMEIEVPAKHPQVFSHIKRQHRHLLQLETVLMTVYYPTRHNKKSLRERATSGPSRELWLGRPRFGMMVSRLKGIRLMSIPDILPRHHVYARQLLTLTPFD